MKKYCIKYSSNNNYVKFSERNGKILFQNCSKQEAAIFNLLSEAKIKKNELELNYKELQLDEKFIIEEIEIEIV